MNLCRFEDLAVWQRATSLAVEIYAVSKDGEVGRDFGLCAWITGEGGAIPGTLLEKGWRRREPRLPVRRIQTGRHADATEDSCYTERD